MKRGQLIKHIEKHGCILHHEGARHTMYFNPANGQQSVVGRHGELKNLMCQIVCKQLGIPVIGR